MTTEPANETIHTAMLAIMGEVGYVQKSGEMKGAAYYKFAGEADFIHAIRPAMIKHGVYVYPSAVTSHESETYTTNKGSVMNLDKVAMEFTFVHAPSGTSFVAAAMGAGADSGDKAIPKMLTGALKYALRQSFLIETGDDPDNASSDDQGRGDNRAPRQFSHSRPPFVPKTAMAGTVTAAQTLPIPSLRDKLGVPLEWKTALNNGIAARKLTNAMVAEALKLSPKDFGEFYALVFALCEEKKLSVDALLDEMGETNDA